ncbi:MAG: alpha-ribazole phosphatase [Vulcanimicrobiaceae bacterium]
MFFAHDIALAVVRHGRTAWNADGRFQGQTDVPLDDTGRAQAAALGALLAGDVFDVAIASDLGRARDTATIVLGARELALDLDPAWREMRFGIWEGLAWPQIVAGQPELARDAAAKPKFYTPDGGEAFDDVCRRVEAALRALDARVGNGARVLVVTHAGVLHALLRVVLGESEAAALDVRFSPATVTRFALGPAGNRLVELNRSPADDVPA